MRGLETHTPGDAVITAQRLERSSDGLTAARWAFTVRALYNELAR